MPSSVAYCTLAEAKSLLPKAYLGRGADTTGDLPDTTDTTTTSLTTLIIRASREIDSALAPHFCTFNAHDHATFPTPPFIREIARRLSASMAFEQLAIGDRNTAYGAKAKDLRDEAQVRLDNLTNIQADGAADPRWYLIPAEVVSETLTFGAGGQYDLQAQEAFIQVQANLTSVDIPTVLPDSVKVTATGLTLYARGRDFAIRFDPMHQRWVFVDLTGALYVLGTTKSISYDWTYRRHSEKQTENESDTMYLGGWQ